MCGAQDGYKKVIPIDPNMVREKSKSLYDNLKQKEGERSKAEEFNASTGWFDNFRKKFGLKNVKITGEAASVDKEAADEFPDAITKIIEEKGYLLEQVFSADESALFRGKKMPQRTFISKEEKQAPGLKARRDRLTVLFRVNVVGFTIRTALICKAVNPPALKGKDKHQLPVSWLYKAWTARTLFF